MYSNEDFISPEMCCYTILWKSKLQNCHLLWCHFTADKV